MFQDCGRLNMIRPKLLDLPQIFNQSRQFCADPGTLCVIHTFVSNICQPSRDHRGGDISPHHAEAPPYKRVGVGIRVGSSFSEA